MTSPRIVFDENFGRPYIDALAQFFEKDRSEGKAEVRHVFDLFPGGAGWDEAWIPKIAAEGWIIISADRGKKGGKKKGDKLPRVCAAFRVTHVLLTNQVANRKMFDRILTVLSVWYQILALASEPLGSRFALEPVDLEPHTRGRGILTRREVRGGRPPLKGHLF